MPGKLITIQRGTALAWCLALLFVALASFLGASYNMPLSQATPGQILLVASAADTQAEEIADEAKKGDVQIPTGLVVVLAAGLFLIVFYVFKALIERYRSSREEVVVHSQKYEPPTGLYGTPASSSPQTREGTADQGSGTEYRIPPEQPRQPSPGTGQPRPGTIRKKGGVWPTLIFAIILINIIRQCMHNR